MRILVIEDEKRIADNLKKGLEMENYTVDVAYDGLDGVEMAEAEDYDLVLLDLMLPELAGMDVCKRLRNKGQLMPILMLTARGQTEDKVRGLDAGGDDYLTKPFAFEELLARIRSLVRRAKESEYIKLEVADLKLDPKEFEVFRGKKQIQLSSKEYALLEYLVRHKGQVVTKEQIIRNIWSIDDEVLPNTVEVYIKKLREKIDLPFKKKKLIQTVRGFGYKLGEKNV
jgi:two-component system OmpR family response regulator